jgi:hypothetical protein
MVTLCKNFSQCRVFWQIEKKTLRVRIPIPNSKGLYTFSSSSVRDVDDSRSRDGQREGRGGEGECWRFDGSVNFCIC